VQGRLKHGAGCEFYFEALKTQVVVLLLGLGVWFVWLDALAASRAWVCRNPIIILLNFLLLLFRLLLFDSLHRSVHIGRYGLLQPYSAWLTSIGRQECLFFHLLECLEYLRLLLGYLLQSTLWAAYLRAISFVNFWLQKLLRWLTVRSVAGAADILRSVIHHIGDNLGLYSVVLR